MTRIQTLHREILEEFCHARLLQCRDADHIFLATQEKRRDGKLCRRIIRIDLDLRSVRDASHRLLVPVQWTRYPAQLDDLAVCLELRLLDPRREFCNFLLFDPRFNSARLAHVGDPDGGISRER